MNIFRIIIISGLMITGQRLDAFVPVVNPSAQRHFLTEDEQVSLANPLSHGDLTARQSGTLDSVSLRYEENTIRWTGLKSERGLIQAWGAPFIRFQADDRIQEMDAALRSFIDENSVAFQVRSSMLRLDPNRTKFSGPYRYLTYVRFEEVPDEGVFPVEGAFITFRFKFGGLIQITNYSFGKISAFDRSVISQEDAIDAVVHDSGFVEKRDSFSGKIQRQIQPFYAENGELRFRFVYQVQLRKREPSGLYLYSVGGADGKVVRILNQLHTSGHVTAEVFSRLPSDSITQVSLPETNVKNGVQTGKTDFEGNYSLDPEGTVAELSGTRAIIREGGSRLPENRAGADGEILFSASQNLSESMPFYFVNIVNRFVRNFIKSAPRDTIKGKVDFLNTPIVINTRVSDAPIKSCNAWFDPEAKTLNFLEADSRCEASSQFADIIFHEWGHALDDALGGIQDHAFSEGIGDVVSALMTGDPRIGPGFLKGGETPIRDIRAMKVYPRDRARDPHLESLIISGAWFEVLQMMNRLYGDGGRVKTAEIFFKHLVATDSYLDSYMGALAVDDDDGNLDNCTPHMCVLNIAFSKRGIAPADPRCFSESATSVDKLPACALSTIKPPRD